MWTQYGLRRPGKQSVAPVAAPGATPTGGTILDGVGEVEINIPQCNLTTRGYPHSPGIRGARLSGQKDDFHAKQILGLIGTVRGDLG